MDNLAEVKSKIKFEGVDEEINQRCMSWIQRPNDCFGHRYDSADQEECGTCIVMADVNGRKEPTWVFCKELCEQKNDEPSLELKEAIQEIQTQKKEKEKAKPVDLSWKIKMISLIGTMENKGLVEAISLEFGLDSKKVRLTLAWILSSQKRKSNINK